MALPGIRSHPVISTSDTLVHQFDQDFITVFITAKEKVLIVSASVQMLPWLHV